MWFSRGSHSDSYFVARVASSICSEPPRHSVTSSPVELDVDAARVGSGGAVRLEESTHLVDDVVEASRLVAGRRRESVAVHRVGHPERHGIHSLDRFEQRRQRVAHLACPHPRDEGEAARLAVGVELVDQPFHVVGGCRRPELHADGVADAREVVDVRTVELAGALPDPEEVRARVDRGAVARVDARHRALVVHEQTLVRGVELHPAQFVEVGSGRLHELHGAVDLFRETLVPLVRRVRRESLVPGVHLPEVGETTLRERTDQVQRRCGRVVPLHEAPRIGLAGLGREVVAVDDVAAVGRQGHVAASLVVARPGLGELTRHAPHLDDRHRGAVGEHDGHLQQRLHAVADLVGCRAGERLGAVPALQQEGLATRGAGEPVPQDVDLTGEHERRVARDLGGRCRDGFGIRPLGLLLDRQSPPIVEARENARLSLDDGL